MKNEKIESRTVQIQELKEAVKKAKDLKVRNNNPGSGQTNIVQKNVEKEAKREELADEHCINIDKKYECELITNKYSSIFNNDCYYPYLVLSHY